MGTTPSQHPSRFDGLNCPACSYGVKPEQGSDGRPSIIDELLHSAEVRRRTDAGGDWPFEPGDLIRQLLDGELSLYDSHLQALLLDWIEAEDHNVFLNQDTGEFVYVLSAKRGNKVYATRKSKKRNEIEAALDGKEFDIPVKGFRNRRYTRLLLTTVNFDREQYTAEEAWAALRSTPTEGADYEYNVMNNLNANISKIFGKHGTLTAKEAQSSGYPAPHCIYVLDKPVMVEEHRGKGGNESWRICDPRILDRIGKGPLMRKLCRTDHRKAIRMNPIWKHGFIDFEGIVKGDGSRSGRDTVSYAFKYLVKCLTEDGKSSIKDLPDISSVKDKGLRTMLFTHLGNKCFRTRDVSFGKGFKDRIGLLPEPKSEEKSPWKLVKTITEQEFNLIQACIRLGLVDNTPNS